MAQLTKDQRIRVLARLRQVSTDVAEDPVVRAAARTLVRTQRRDGDELRAAFDTIGDPGASAPQKVNAIRIVADILR